MLAALNISESHMNRRHSGNESNAVRLKIEGVHQDLTGALAAIRNGFERNTAAHHHLLIAGVLGRLDWFRLLTTGECLKVLQQLRYWEPKFIPWLLGHCPAEEPRMALGDRVLRALCYRTAEPLCRFLDGYDAQPEVSALLEELPEPIDLRTLVAHAHSLAKIRYYAAISLLAAFSDDFEGYVQRSGTYLAGILTFREIWAAKKEISVLRAGASRCGGRLAFVS
jgi:hypothetical protein